MKIGKHFTLDELTVTHSGLLNVPNKASIDALTLLVNNVLDPVREMLGEPIIINSGYRSLRVNKAAGGVATSQHLSGEAADMDCSDNAKLFHLIRDHFVFDQLIWEGGDDKQPAWVHVSYKLQGNRGEVKQMKVIKGKKTYIRL
ncbi:MAG TPA: D-Ala-D-Ala carboxypeptidase family metallohydrolase [Paludibacter sp.]|nr:D-Ala-D-Ala carboxypeptidase family metallohydrolase [Paludibacter sp.]